MTRAEFGPEAEKLYGAARAALEASARGGLSVDAGRPDARIYLNEVGRGRGGTFDGDLWPGTYRILVEVSGVGRRYTATVEPGRRTRLEIDWETDARFTATAQWIGFVWPRGAHDRTAQLAQRFARGNALDDAIVVGIVHRGAHRYVIGHTYRRESGVLERVGSIQLGEPGEPGAADAAKLAALADYLSNGERAGEVVRVGEPPWRPPRGSRAPVWASAAVAIAALGAGGYLVAIDSRGTCGAPPPAQCPRLHDTARLGWTLVGGGVAAIGFGVSWYVARTRPRAPSIAVQRSATGSFATMAWSF